jgi:hypothetical protein
MGPIKYAIRGDAVLGDVRREWPHLVVGVRQYG